jgi:hypothetical protein
MLAILPLSRAVATPVRRIDAGAAEAPTQSSLGALREALGQRSYVLLVLGFYTCGFQLAFVTVHFQRYVVDIGL